MTKPKKSIADKPMAAAAQTGIRFTEDDRELIAWLQQATGAVSVTEVVRMGLRALKREQERIAKK